MCIYLKNISAKFHLDPIWYNKALGFFEDIGPNKNKNSKMTSDIGWISSWSKNTD